MSTRRFSLRWIPPGEYRVVDETRQAVSLDSLRREVEDMGGRLLDAVPEQGPASARAAMIERKVDIGWWCHEFATLVRAGMTAVEAMETLRLQANAPALASLQEALLHSLRQGRSLSAAMDESGAFPLVLVASVRASERTSNLATALEDFLQYDRQIQELRRQAVGAAIYPGIVMTLGVVIALFLLMVVMPRFSKMYGTLHGAVSGPTAWMLWLSSGIAHALPEIVGVLLAAVSLGIVAWRARLWHALGRKVVALVPMLRKASTDFKLSQLYQSLALTLRGGYPLLEAMSVCMSLGLGDAMVSALAGASAAIERGQAPSRALHEAGLADAVAERLLRVGERTGQFSPVLQTLAERHGQAFRTFVQRATRLIEPMLLLAVALVVGGIVVMMYMPIFDIANGMR